MMTRLLTDRLMMRRAQPSDVDAVHAMVSDFDVVRMTSSWPWPPDLSETRQRCVPFDPEFGMIGLVFRAKTLVGSMGIAVKDGGAPTFGYMFAKPHWGNGYATEMGGELIAHCWARYDWPQIDACVFHDNPASIRVLDKLGFEETGACKGDSLARGAAIPLRNFRLSRPQT